MQHGMWEPDAHQSGEPVINQGCALQVATQVVFNGAIVVRKALPTNADNAFNLIKLAMAGNTFYRQVKLQSSYQACCLQQMTHLVDHLRQQKRRLCLQAYPPPGFNLDNYWFTISCQVSGALLTSLSQPWMSAEWPKEELLNKLLSSTALTTKADVACLLGWLVVTWELDNQPLSGGNQFTGGKVCLPPSEPAAPALFDNFNAKAAGVTACTWLTQKSPGYKLFTETLTCLPAAADHPIHSRCNRHEMSTILWTCFKNGGNRYGKCVPHQLPALNLQVPATPTETRHQSCCRRLH